MLEEYTLEEPKQQDGRSPDSLIQAIDRIERLEKQLFVAKCALESYADSNNWRDIFEEDGDDSEWHDEALYFATRGYESAQYALKQIKELEK